MSYHCFAMDSTVESSPPKWLCEIVGVVSCSGPVRHRPPVELHGPSRMDPSLLPKFRLLAWIFLAKDDDDDDDDDGAAVLQKRIAA